MCCVTLDRSLHLFEPHSSVKCRKEVGISFISRVMRMEINCCFWDNFAQCLASVGAVIVNCGFTVGALLGHLLVSPFEWQPCVERSTHWVLSDVFCPGDFCSLETGMYFRKDLILG